MSNSTSLSLLDTLARGAQNEAWNRFTAIYQPLLESWLRSRGIPHDVVSDVQQEVLTKVLEEIGRFEHNGRPGAFRNWLRTIMSHRLRTIQRQQWRGGPRLDWSDIADGLADDDSDLSRQWQVEHDAYLLRRLIDLISHDFSPASIAAFKAVVLQGRPQAEVATELGLSLNAVRIAQSRVLAALRRVAEGLID